ncbi:Zn-ribbon domain-containing OB-fold protein [Acuticoccus mangrovi]|uniref:OB-fold domain-containing protein n=1 Tax=Acuticoccus mangrovi TaxID=2796142 RepID=A0A934MIP2_9HYPH|nr:OB-fold domain-containing protein [Acuticoccus mangrovi]MBJ3778120.1 OB-fold domain-containing protein [Acuticoccus mangrovi]
MTDAIAKPRPPKNGAERPFWEGLAEGKIRVQQCDHCGTKRFPASRYCPACHKAGARWVAVEPTGTVQSFCVFHKSYFPGFAAEMPYAVVEVKLDCGVEFFSNMVDTPNEAIHTGQRVRAAFVAEDDVVLLKFRPADAS